MQQEVVEEMSAGAAGGVRASYGRLRQSAPDSRGSVVVEFEVFLWGCFPVKDIRLIPNFPPPLVNRWVAVPLQAVCRPGKAELLPFFVIFWRITEAKAGADHLVRRRIVWVIFRVNRKCLRHKANFHKWLQVQVIECVEDPI